MQVITALLVDEVRKHDTGGVDLIGLFEDIFLDAVPVKLESLSIYVDLSLEPADKGTAHTLEFALVCPDGTAPDEPTAIRFSVPPHDDFPRESAQLDLVLFDQTFPVWGTYHVVVRKNGEILRRIPLHVSPKTDYDDARESQTPFAVA